MAGDVVDPLGADIDDAAVAHPFKLALSGNQHALFPHHQQRTGGLRNPLPLRIFALFEAPGLAVGRAQHDLAAIHLPGHRRKPRDHLIAGRLQADDELLAGRGVRTASTRRPAGRCGGR